MMEMFVRTTSVIQPLVVKQHLLQMVLVAQMGMRAMELKFAKAELAL